MQSTAARAIALDLLGAVGADVATIPRGTEGQPIWPSGIVGSLAHTYRYAAAAVARDSNALSLGIDIEPNLPLLKDTRSIVLTPHELQRVSLLPTQIVSVDRMYFCAKECLHKAIFPLRGTWLEFNEVKIDIDDRLCVFQPIPVSARAQLAFAGLQGHGVIQLFDGHIVALLALHAI